MEQLYCETLANIISQNEIHTTPNKSVTDQLYRIGDNTALVIVQCDINGNPIIAHCKHGSKFIKFTNKKDAKFISDACKQRLNAQIKEQEKINQYKQIYR